MTQQEVIEIGQLEIRYLIDGAARSGMGVFALMVPAGSIDDNQYAFSTGYLPPQA